jgi:hypothetical protein
MCPPLLPTRNRFPNLTDTRKHEQKESGTTNPLKIDQRLNETIPKFAQIKFNKLQIYPQEIIA